MLVTTAMALVDFVSRFAISVAGWTEVIVSEVIESTLPMRPERTVSLASLMPLAFTVTVEPFGDSSCEHFARKPSRLSVLLERLTVPRMPLAATLASLPATALSWSLPSV